MSRLLRWRGEYNPLTGKYLRDSNPKINPVLVGIPEEKYSKAIVIYGPHGEELINKSKPAREPFGFNQESNL